MESWQKIASSLSLLKKGCHKQYPTLIRPPFAVNPSVN